MSTSPMSAISRSNGTWARGVNAVLGMWLIVSAFAWPHAMAQQTNTWILGVFAVLFAGVGTYVSAMARWVNAAIASLLFISAFTLPSISKTTVANDLIVAVAMFACSLVPSTVRRHRAA
jgi:hypothetical protein